jgi:hypothetical protein
LLWIIIGVAIVFLISKLGAFAMYAPFIIGIIGLIIIGLIK